MNALANRTWSLRLAIVLAAGAAGWLPQPALAFTCDSVTQPAGGNSGANDNGDNSNTACGRNAVANGTFASAFGNAAQANAESSTAVGAAATVDATSIQGVAVGRNATVNANSTAAIAVGRNATVSANSEFGVAIGESSNSSGVRAVAIGKSSSASGERSVASGAGATASGEHSTAMGAGSGAGGGDATAVGYLATANNAHSTAIGTGATTTQDNQIVYGTGAETHTMAGVTSDLSRSRQTGPLQLLTTDAAGNLASDNGAVFGMIEDQSDRIDRANRRIDDTEEGVALALAVANPDLVGNERFGVALNYGNFEGSDALGGAVTGVVASNLFGDRGRFAISGGFGVGLDEGVVGGRVGGQLTW